MYFTSHSHRIFRPGNGNREPIFRNTAFLTFPRDALHQLSGHALVVHVNLHPFDKVRKLQPSSSSSSSRRQHLSRVHFRVSLVHHASLHVKRPLLFRPVAVKRTRRRRRRRRFLRLLFRDGGRRQRDPTRDDDAVVFLFPERKLQHFLRLPCRLQRIALAFVVVYLVVVVRVEQIHSQNSPLFFVHAGGFDHLRSFPREHALHVPFDIHRYIRDGRLANGWWEVHLRFPSS